MKEIALLGEVPAGTDILPKERLCDVPELWTLADFGLMEPLRANKEGA
jgi:hypothetical protein